MVDNIFLFLISRFFNWFFTNKINRENTNLEDKEIIMSTEIAQWYGNSGIIDNNTNKMEVFNMGDKSPRNKEKKKPKADKKKTTKQTSSIASAVKSK